MIQNVLAILLKFGSTFLFVLLEILCIYLIVQNNNNQAAIWANSSNIFIGKITKHYNELNSFIGLRKENENLAKENAALRAELIARNYQFNRQDSLMASSYDFIPAIIINNSTSKINNRITLNKGKKDGVEKGMGVISNEGVVGVVSYVNDQFCIVNSILNIQTHISGMVKRTRSLGDLQWDGDHPAFVTMKSIPQYVPLLLGDTVMTSGYSTVFPKGHNVGVISNIKNNSKTGYYDIKIELASDLVNIEQVYIVRNALHSNIQKFQEESSE